MVEITSLDLYRRIATGILIAADVKQNDEFEWKANELATQLLLKVSLITKHYKAMDRLADSKKLAVSWSVVIDRSITPSIVEVKGSFGEKHKMKAKSDTPDPNAKDLPGLSREELAQETQPEGAESETHTPGESNL